MSREPNRKTRRKRGWLERNPGIAVLFFIVCIAVAASVTTVRANMDSSNRVASVNRQTAEAEKMMQAEARLKKRREAIANSWYDDGCVIVVALKDPGKLTSLTVGLPVIDRTRKTPLSAGTVVCDADGNTSRLIKNSKGEPVVGETYFTGDRKRIEKAVKRSNARYALPNQ